MSGEYEKAISIGKAIQNIASRRYLMPAIQFERQVISVLLTVAGRHPNGRFVPSSSHRRYGRFESPAAV